MDSTHCCVAEYYLCRVLLWELIMNKLASYCDNVLAKLPAGRLLSVDIFRGITIAGMILVSNHGDKDNAFPSMLHAEWHGWTPTDLIFPFFLFIVGISMVMSFDKQMQAGKRQTAIMKAATIRGLKIYALGAFLGVFYYNFYDPSFNWWVERVEGIRFMGVLQRIGIVFILTAAIVLVTGLRGRIAALSAALIGYWALMTYVPYTLPNGETAIGLWDYANNFAAAMDHYILGSNHTYFRNTEPFAFDLLGVVSTITAVATCLSGVLVGMVLQSGRTNEQNVKLLVLGGVIAIVLGNLLNPIVPINKPIWTSSYVIMSSGFAMLSLGALIWLVDMKGFKRWAAPFVVYGANSIAFYMLSGVVGKTLGMIRFDGTSAKTILYQNTMEPLFNPAFASLAFGLMMLAIYYVVMNMMYKRNIFWKV